MALAVVVLSDHLRRGGFVQDDWWLQSLSRFPPDSTPLAGFGNLVSEHSDRPMLGLYIAAVHTLLGNNPTLHVVWGVLVAVAVSSLLYGVIRRCGVPVVPAGVVALLTLLFPAADATLLWPTAASYHWAMVLFLLGAMLALQSSSVASPRRRLLIRAGSLLLYATSVLTVEALFGPVLMTLLLNRAAGFTWPVAVRHWLLDVGACAAAVGLIALRTPRDVASASEQVDHAGEIFEQGRHLIEAVGFVSRQPYFSLPAVLLVLVALGIAARFTLPRSLVRDLDRELALVVVGLLAIAAGYLMYVPASTYYSPFSPGIANRVNAVASPGFALVLIGLIAAFATPLRLIPRGAAVMSAVIVIVALVVAMEWSGELRRDADAYDRSFEVQQQAVTRIVSVMPRPPDRAHVYSFGLPAQVERGVPIFFATWDLTGALRLGWGRGDVTGIPSTTITSIECGPDGVRPVGPAYTRAPAARYGRAVLIQVPERTLLIPRSAAACRTAVDRLLPKTHAPPGSRMVPNQLAITPWTLPSAQTGKPYQYRLRASGGVASQTWSVENAARLPPGLKLTAAGELGGVPRRAGMYRFVAIVTDAWGARGVAPLLIPVKSKAGA